MRASNPETNPIKAKTFAATLERTADRLRWVIARVPFDAAKLWGKRGQIKVLGEINGFAFSTTLFPDGQGHHFFIVNKKMLSGGKTAAGLTAKFRLQPDTTPRITFSPSAELLRELGQSKRLLKFFESLNPSRRHEIAKWIAQCKTSEARKRMSPSHRRAHLFSIFHYREPEARARQVAKAIEQMLGRKPERGNKEDFSETI
jgi:hypothetical protein